MNLLTDQQIEDYAKDGKWQFLLKDYCKQNELDVKFTHTNGMKKIEIFFEGKIAEMLMAQQPESDFHGISQAMLSRLIEGIQ